MSDHTQRGVSGRILKMEIVVAAWAMLTLW